MIDISFVSFQCYVALGEQPAIDHHMKCVHGIPNGIVSLKEKVEIEVDSKSAFTLPSLLDIELLGPGKRANLISSVFTNCVARGVFKKNTNDDQSDLNLNRSRDFMSEMKKSCTSTYLKDLKCIYQKN